MAYIEIGASPANEDCAQVGNDGYAEQAKRECNAFRDQILRMIQAGDIPPMPEGARLMIKSFPHDFGSYYELVAAYNTPEGENWAYEVERLAPNDWDHEARIELGLVEQTIIM